MALRLDENSITKGTIDNRTEGEILVKIAFTDGFYTEIAIKGNPSRDMAGRLVSIYHPNPDENLKHADGLVPLDKAAAGDITAARKVKAPTISLKETGEYYLKKKKIPYVWKNSLYLEWYTLNGGRCVLEATELVITSSEPEWNMSDVEEKKAHEDAGKGFSTFLGNLGNTDESRKKLDKTLQENDGELDEFGWEKLFKHSDNATDRYRELLDKYEDEEKVSEEMGWGEKESEPDFTVSHDPIDWDEVNEMANDPQFLAEFEADSKAQENHPIRVKAKQILLSLESPRTTEVQELGEIWSAVATVGAKLAGAFSGYHADGSFDDKGYVIAQMKRVLIYLNEAYEMMVKEKHPKMQDLMELRQSIIDLQTELRKK